MLVTFDFLLVLLDEAASLVGAIQNRMEQHKIGNREVNEDMGSFFIARSGLFGEVNNQKNAKFSPSFIERCAREN